MKIPFRGEKLLLEKGEFPIQSSPKFLWLAIKLSIGLFLIISLAGISFASAMLLPGLSKSQLKTNPQVDKAVLGSSTQKVFGKLSFNIPTFFTDTATFQQGTTFNGKAVFNNDIQITNHDLDLGTGKLTAANIVYGVTAGPGITTSGGQNPTITNTGVLSVQGQTGAITFGPGTGIKFDGLKINNTGVTSVQGQNGAVTLTAGSGVSIDGTTISSTSQGANAFGTIASGGTSISAGSTNDTFTFTAGSGVSITPDTTTKTLTFSSNSSPNLSFASLTSGTNTAAAMIVGSGASLTTAGSGTINATSLMGATFASPGAIGATTPNTGSFTTLSASSTTTFNSQTYTWPTSTGSNGYVLQTNGLGTLSWVAATGGGTNYWALTGSTISPANGAQTVLLGSGNALANAGLDVEVNGSGNAVVVVNQTGTGPIFTASSSGTAKFTIANDGSITDAGYGLGIVHSNASGIFSSSAVNLANNDVTGILPYTSGGTGTNNTPSNGQILIGNGSGYTLASISQGSNIVVTSGAGSIAIATSATPSFTTVNGLTITNNGTNTLNIAGGKTLTVSNTLTLSGTDATSFTLPTASDTLVGRASTDTLTNKTINAASNTISGLTNTNLSGTAGITNANLANSSITVNAGTGLSGGGSVSLGSNVTINNAGVTSVTGTTNQVNVSASTGSVIFSLPQSINSGASPTFTNVTLSGLSTGIGHFNASGILSSSAIGLGSSDVTGIVGVANGGTGLSSLTAGSIIYGNGTGTFNTLAIGGTNSCLISNGATPTWSACSGVGTNYFQRNSGVLSPITITDTLAVGTVTPLANSGLDIEQNALGNAAFVDNQTGTGDILTASASGTTRLTLTNTGNLNLATGAYQISGTSVIDTARDFINIAGIATSLNPTVANTDNLGTSTGNQYNTIYGKTIFQNGNTVCDTSGNCIGGTGGTIGGSGITNYIAKFSDSSHLTSSLLYDTGTQLGVGSTTPDAFFAIKGGNYGGNAAIIVNQNGAATNDIFSASSSGITKFTIGNDGTLTDIKYGTGIAHINASGVFSSAAITLNSADVTNTLPIGNGGTGTTTFTTNGILYGNGTSALQVTAQGASGTVLHGNGISAPSFSAISLTADVSGILPIANGGTNANLSAIQGGIVYSGAAAMAISAAGSAGNCLLSGGTGAPTWGNCTVGGGTNYWTISGSTISPANGATNVAIGVPTGLANSGLDIEVNSLGNSAFVVNNTGGSGDILTASSAGTPKFKIDKNGVLSLAGNQTIDITTLTAGNSLIMQPATWATGSTGGNVTIKGGTAVTTGGNVVITGGSGTNGGTGVGGNVNIDPGTGNGVSNGSINIGTLTPGAILIGGSTQTAGITLGQSTAINTINIGNANTASGNTQTINIGAGNINANGTTALTIGNAINNTSLALLAGTGNITLGNAVGNGTVVVQPNAGGQAAFIVNKQGSNDIFTASASGTTKFLLDHNGNITASNYSTGIAHFSSVGLLSSSAIGLNTSDVTNTLGVGNGGTGIASLASGSLLYGAGGTSALNTLSITGTTGECLTSNGSVPSWGSCGGGGTNYWQLNSGIITPATLTNTLSIGVPTNTTSLATVDIRSLNGIEAIASISGKTSFAALTVDNSGTGDILTASSSGLNRFVITQNGNVGVGTSTPGNLFQVAGTIGIQNSQTLTGVANFVQVSNGISVGGSTTYNITNGGVANLSSGSNVTNNGPSYFQVGSTAGAGSFSRMYADLVRNGDFALADGNANSYIYAYAGAPLSGIPIGSIAIGTNVTSPHAVLDVEGGNTGGNAALIVNQTGAVTNDIFAASASGTPKFVIANTGNITASNYSTGIAHFGSTGLLSSAAIGLTSSDITGTLGVGNGGTGIASIANGSLLVGAGSTTAMSALAVGGNGQCLTSNGTSPIWGSCSASGNFWQLTTGALAPANTTNDLIVGGNATSSAAFQVFGSIYNAGSGAVPYNVPAGTASTSGQLTFGTAGGNTPQINILNGNSLSFISSPGGDTGEAGTPILKIGHSGLVLIDASATTGPFDLAVGGDIGPSTDVGANLGNASFRFNNTYSKQLYVGNGLTGGSVPATVGIFSNINTKGNGLLILNQVGTIGDIIDASSSGTLAFQVTNNGNIAVNGGSITTTQATANIFNSIPTTLNIGGGATTISIGASSGTTTINNTLALAGLSTGSLPFINSSNQITQDNSNLFWDATNKRLGIGNNTSLLGTLDLRSTSGTIAIATISGKTSFAALTVDNSGTGDIFTASSSGLNRFVITQNGNVGIGKTNPSATVDILGINGAAFNDAPTALNVLGGTGGVSGSTAGAGGGISLIAGVGGSGTGLNANGGTGGALTLAGGTGGAASQGLSDGVGGLISITGGTGGSGCCGASGGNVYITGGAAGGGGGGATGNLILAQTSGGTNQGNVGIGVSNPQSLLSVAGTAEFGSGDNGTPLAETIRGAAASGSNIAGAAMTVDASNGTGTGGSGNIQFRTASSNGTVTLDAKSMDIAASATTMSWSHTTGTQTNRILMVSVQIAAAGVTVAANGVTYGGTALTKEIAKVGSCNGTTNLCDTELWYMKNPTSGTNTIQVTTTGGTATDLIADAATFYNVDQTTPLGTAASRAAATVSPHTLSVTSTVKQLVVSAIADTDYDNPTQPQFSAGGQSGSLIFGGMSYTPGSASTTTMSWTAASASDNFAIVGVPLNPVATATIADSLNPILTLNANGNVGIGNMTTPQRTLDVNGSWGGNVIIDNESAAGNISMDVDGQGLVYQLTDNSGNQTGNVEKFNITGLPNVDGTMAFVYLNPQKKVSAGAGTNCLNLTVNGSSSLLTTNICTLSQTGADSSQFAYLEVIRINGTWRGLVSNTTNKADLAEWISYTGTKPANGELVSIDQHTSVTQSSTSYDPALAGIVTTNPNTIYGQETPTTVAVALAGRIPAIVTSLNGDIHSGEGITSSPLFGVGMRPTKAAQTVGKALESFSPGSLVCTQVTSYDAIVWPADDGSNPASPCFAVPVSSFTSTIQGILLQQYGLAATDNIYVGKIMVLANLSYTSAQSAVEKIVSSQPGLLEAATAQTAQGNTLLQALADSQQTIASQGATTTFTDTMVTGTLFADTIKANHIEGLDIMTNQLTHLSDSVATSDALTKQNSTTLATLQSQIASFSAQTEKLSQVDLISQRLAILEKTIPSLTGLSSMGNNDATVSGQLSVLGKTILSDVGITGKVSMGLLTMDGMGSDPSNPVAEINTLSGPLKIQPLGLGGVDFLNGKILIDTLGNMTINAEVTAKKYNIDTTNPASASLGEATLPAGETQVNVSTTAVTADSKIFVTAESVINKPLTVTAKTTGKSFTVQIASPVGKDVKFSWWIVN